MSTPLFFDRTTFKNIPADHGIYAFFLDSNSLYAPSRPIQPRRRTFHGLLRKPCEPPHERQPREVGTTPLSKEKRLQACCHWQTSHHIRCGPSDPMLTTANMAILAGVLEKCSLFAGPLYIGIAAKQTLRKRFSQHQRAYTKYKKSFSGKPGLKDRAIYQRGGKFYHRLVHRRIEFRDLIYACVPLTQPELAQVRYVEKLLHALAAPSMSESH